MKKYNRQFDRGAFDRAMDEFLDQWWDQELLTEVAHWVKKLADNKDHDPECLCHDYYRGRLLAAVKALRVWREMTKCTRPQHTAEEELALLDELLGGSDENAN